MTCFPLKFLIANPQPSTQHQGVLSASSNPKARLQLVREISLLDIGRPLLHMALVPPTITNLQQRHGSSGSVVGTAAGASGAEKRTQEGPNGNGESVTPWQCVLLRWGGLMSVLDLARGSEVQLSSEVREVQNFAPSCMICFTITSKVFF